MRILSVSLITTILIALTCFAEEKGSGEKTSYKEWPAISLTPAGGGFEKPTHITHAGDSSGRLFVVEQKGRIFILNENTLARKLFLDIRDRVGCCGERGLLSVVFPQGHSDKKLFYVNYTNKKGNTVIARYRTTASQDAADTGSEKILLTIKQPFSNHNGGQMAFGPDGYLYIGTGDGGFAGDPFDNGQDPGSLLGKILRINVESGVFPYSVPADNPFVKKKGFRPEIWSLGLRNPWRFSFDRRTGDLYIADVGQNSYEEVNFQSSGSAGGENYGWNIMEGLHCYGSPDCSTSGFVLPVAEYDHSYGCSVTGGNVYRGKRFPSLSGIYLYADYCSGNIWGLKKSGATWLNNLFIKSGFSVSTFGENEDGEIFLADYSKGDIYRIEAK